MAGPPATFPSLKRAIGWAKEITPGTPVAPVAYLPVTKFDWNDKPTWLEDKALRGVMGDDVFNLIQGVKICEIDMAGPVFGDEFGYIAGNIFGDVTATGTAIAPTGTLSALSIVGAASVSSSVSIPNGTLIQIDVGVNAEIVTTSGAPTGAGPFTIPVPALAKPHASGVAITAINAAPLAHRFALNNSLSGQGTTHTITQFYGPEPTHNARQFSGACLSDVGLTFNAETEMLMWTAKGISWVSNVAGATPIPTFTTAKPLPSWQALLGVAGPASGGTQVMSIYKGEFNVKRALRPYFTAQGVQNPYIIQRGGLSSDFKLTYVAADESALTAMNNNTQPQVQCVINNGLTGANALGVQVDQQQSAYTEARPSFGREAIEFDVVGRSIFNSTNTGYTGGLGPATWTLNNAVAAGSFI